MLTNFIKKQKKSPKTNCMINLKEKNIIGCNTFDKKENLINSDNFVNNLVNKDFITNSVNKDSISNNLVNKDSINDLIDINNLNNLIVEAKIPNEIIKKSKRKKNIIQIEGNCSLLEDFNFKKVSENIIKKDEVDKIENICNNIIENDKYDISNINDSILDCNLINNNKKEIKNDFSIIFSDEVNSSICKDNSLTNINGNKNIECNKSVKNTDSFINNINDITNNSLEFRKMAIINNATKNINIPYDKFNCSIYLPTQFKRLSELYKVLKIVYDFNKKRNLNLIYCKYQKSIERMFKKRVDLLELEQLNYLIPENIKFTPIKINDNGVKTNTFTIHVDQVDIDKILYEYLILSYKKWCNKILENNLNVKILTNKFHQDFKMENIKIPSVKFLKEKVIKEEIIKVAKEKSNSIFERIKEKERLKREEFILNKNKEFDFEKKMDDIFIITNKKAIKLEELIFRIGEFDSKNQILKIIGNKYILKKIDDIEYVLLNNTI